MVCGQVPMDIIQSIRSNISRGTEVGGTPVTGYVQEHDEAQEPDEGHMNSSGFFFFRSG